MIQSPDEPWSVSHCSGLELGADGLTKPLQGQAFTRFLSLIGMMEDEPGVNISKVVGPTSSSSSAASNGFNKALTGVGAAIMGVGALTDSEPLVLCGLVRQCHCIVNGMELKAILGNTDYIMTRPTTRDSNC